MLSMKRNDCECPQNECSNTNLDSVILYGGLGAALSYLISLMMPAAAVSIPINTTLPNLTLGRNFRQIKYKKSQKAEITCEDMARSIIKAIQNFSNVIKRPICADKYLCEATSLLKNDRRFSSAFSLLSSVAGQFYIKDILDISESSLEILLTRHTNKCHGYSMCLK
ncbi:hypothetical protein CHUAL_012406 [Chamberlinius hualienensis]